MKKLFLFLFYAAIKNLVKISFWIFYRERVVLHPEHLNTPGPKIIVSNHPSTLMDPLQVGIEIDAQAHFLINAGLVEHWFANWFFTTFYCIPVKRSKDTGDRKINNAESFAKANEFLAKGGTLYIAPEGVSNMERRLQDLKTGLARIALSAEDAKDFNLNLQILPFGLNYTGLRFFRSAMVMEVGEPFGIKKYQEIYEQDSREAVRQVTEDLAARMRQLIIHTQDESEDQLLKNLGSNLQAESPLPLKEQYLRAKETLKKIQTLRSTDATAYQRWLHKAQTLSGQIMRNQSSEKALYAASMGTLAKNNRSGAFNLLWSFPLFLYGWINNFLPNFLPGFLARKMAIYPGYDPAIKVLSGLVFYPLFYGLQLYLVQWMFGAWWITLFYFLTLYPLGIFAWNYRWRYWQWKKGQSTMRWQKRNEKEVAAMMALQKDLLSEIKNL